jgi:antitoxin (DNA-binding transcriptional repressor) of toxin-antitoxin stability system
MTRIDIEHAKARFLELLELAASGEEIIIDKDQQPFVLLSAAAPRTKRVFGSARGQIQIMPDFDEPLPDFQGHR